MSLSTLILLGVFIVNLTAVFLMVFFERKSPQSIIAWSLTFFVLPILGFLLYTLIGKGPQIGRRKKILSKYVEDKHYQALVDGQLELLQDKNDDKNDFIEFNMRYSNSILTRYNSVEIFTNMTKMYNQLLTDIDHAQKSIHVLYFIIKPDLRGKELLSALERAAKRGCTVRMVIDDVGCRQLKAKHLAPLIAAGAEVHRFLPTSRFMVGSNINYRNHRKIVLIDGGVGYTGGANMGEEYEGKNIHVSPWRDTHMRIQGQALVPLNMRFIQDFQFAAGATDSNLSPLLASPPAVSHVLPMQWVSSGPDSEEENIKIAYIKALYNAKKRILLQTPYLALDDSFMDALIAAAHSGVKVSVMIPGVPDKRYAYYCTTYYAGRLAESGVQILIYPGFLHAKTLVVDDDIAAIGTFNIDIRSFRLHFEITAFLYGEEICTQMAEIFEEDKKDCLYAPPDWDKHKKLLWRMQENFFRLFTPIF